MWSCREQDPALIGNAGQDPTLMGLAKAKPRANGSCCAAEPKTILGHVGGRTRR